MRMRSDRGRSKWNYFVFALLRFDDAFLVDNWEEILRIKLSKTKFRLTFTSWTQDRLTKRHFWIWVGVLSITGEIPISNREEKIYEAIPSSPGPHALTWRQYPLIAQINPVFKAFPARTEKGAAPCRKHFIYLIEAKFRTNFWIFFHFFNRRWAIATSHLTGKKAYNEGS